MSASVQPGYRTLLRLPGVATFFTVALVGRLAYGTGSLALLLQIQHETGSYAEAGTALACYGLTVAVLSPVRGRAIDRYGLRRVLPLLALAYAGALLTIALSHAPAGWLVAISAIAGIVAPPLGPTTRRVWSEVATAPGLLQRAYSLDTVAEETLFTLGAVVTGLIAGAASPAVALLMTALLLLVGTAGMVASPLSRLPGVLLRSTDGRPLRRPAFRRLLLVLIGVGVGLGTIELAVVSTVQRASGTAATGVLLATLSLGSAVGGIAYGHRAWRLPAARQLSVAVVLLAAGLALVAAPTSLVMLGFCLFVTGLFVAPTLIVGFTRSDELTDASTRTEAGTWLNSCLNLGISAGTGLAGVVVARQGAGPTLLVGAAAIAVAALLSTLK
ncbi:MFS transporter [Acidothermaceae bacterium B102]|nr:MFS transporter [Acidothermaceae bacterium B102]